MRQLKAHRGEWVVTSVFLIWVCVVCYFYFAQFLQFVYPIRDYVFSLFARIIE